MSKLKDLLVKYKEVIVYLVFGVLTTLVDLVVFALFDNVFRWDETFSTVLSQLIAMTFAYVTNKIFVFHSETKTAKAFFAEMGMFYVCRIAGTLFSVLYMWLLVDLPNWGVAPWAIMLLFGKEFKWYSFLMKAVSSIVVIIANYIASKLVIFRKKKNETEE